MTLKRIKLVDFTYPIRIDGCSIISSRNITKPEDNSFKFLKHVHPYVWLFILITFILIIIQNSLIFRKNKLVLMGFKDNWFKALQVLIKGGKSFVFIILSFK